MGGRWGRRGAWGAGPLADEHGDEHEGGAEQTAGAEEFAEEEPAEEGGGDGLEAHEHGGVGGWGEALAGDLEGEGERAADGAGVEEGEEDGLDVRWANGLEDHGAGEEEEGGDGELEYDQGGALDTGGEVGDGVDVEGPEEGGAEHEQVASAEGPLVGGAEQVHAGGGEQGGQPGHSGWACPDHGSQQGHQDDVETGDETGVAGGGLGDAGLLQPATGEERATGGPAGFPELAAGCGGGGEVGPEAALQEPPGGQGGQADEITKDVEGERSEVFGDQPLGHEAAAPDDGGGEQGGVGEPRSTVPSGWRVGTFHGWGAESLRVGGERQCAVFGGGLWGEGGEAFKRWAGCGRLSGCPAVPT